MAPTLVAEAIPTRFSAGSGRSAMFRKVGRAVTTTSAVNESTRTASTVKTSPWATVTSRRASAKLIRRRVRVASPVGTPSMRHFPVSSVAEVRSAPPAWSLTMTPRRTPSVSSTTVPVRAPVVSAEAKPARARNRTTAREDVPQKMTIFLSEVDHNCVITPDQVSIDVSSVIVSMETIIFAIEASHFGYPG